MNLQSLLDQAKDLQRQNALDAADGIYRQILAQDLYHLEANYLLGVLYFQRGRQEEALRQFDRTLAINPDFPDALYNRGTLLALLGRPGEALDCFDRILAGEPTNLDALYNRALALWHLGDPARAFAAFDRVLDQDSSFAPAWNNRGNALRALGRLTEAIAAFRRATDLRPDYSEACRNLAGALSQSGDIRQSMAAYRLHAEIATSQYGSETSLPHKDRHDEEQKAYRALRGGMAPQDAFYMEEGAALESRAVNPDLACAAQQWTTASPQIVVIDGLLSPLALERLNIFCKNSTIWQTQFEEGYLGAFPEHGFACPLLAQIAEELRQTFPAIFGSHPLLYHWAFKYDCEMKGIKVHADFAAVNVNFWITPDEANLDPGSGGLVIWDKAAPQDWDFARYNGEAAPIREFLARSGAVPIKIAYRANRAVIFHSDLFHETDAIRFKPGYENRRINITMLFGKRENSTSA